MDCDGLRGPERMATIMGRKPPPAGEDPAERYLRDVIIHGSPGRVIDELQRLREEIRDSSISFAPRSAIRASCCSRRRCCPP